ncbi:dUTP diphosphatase [Spiribacter onubensis]|uniref:dUTP diphosphatase n=1 Tax=Spiribacter onubensis TaxID=3122420 RepID=A0ABV3S6S9_9GAMM
MQASIKLLNKDAVLPTRSSPGSAGLDLYSTEGKDIDPGDRVLVPTGVSVSIPADHVGLIWPRSGLAVKQGIDTMAGVIDSDYRGEIKVALINHSKMMVSVEPGDRIAQLVIQPYTPVQLVISSEIGETHRGERGFGSSGK